MASLLPSPLCLALPTTSHAAYLPPTREPSHCVSAARGLVAAAMPSGLAGQGRPRSVGFGAGVSPCGRLLPAPGAHIARRRRGASTGGQRQGLVAPGDWRGWAGAAEAPEGVGVGVGPGLGHSRGRAACSPCQRGPPWGRQRTHAAPLHQPYGVPERGAEPEQWDVAGLGQAMVDFSALISDDFLESLGLPRGTRVVVDHRERGQVLNALDGCAYKLSAGGSLSNTLVALARLGNSQGSPSGCTAGLKDPGMEGARFCDEEVLPDVAQGQAQPGRSQVHVAMVGSVGSDALGDFYRTKLLRANVHFLSPPIEGGTTGTVIVLTTPDAQRTMLSYQGMSSKVAFDDAMRAVIEKSRVLVVEGYLWELPQTVDAIAEACGQARSKGLLVALTASDTSCVLRHRPQFWNVLSRSAHVLFANTEEARALAGWPQAASPASLARYLSHYCPLVSVTDGEAGSYLGLRGRVVHIPAKPCTPKDTCGAGDAYAAGVLYALLKGAPDLASIGSVGASVAAVVVSQQGARLTEEDALSLREAMSLPDKSLVEGPVFHQMMGLESLQQQVANLTP